MSSLILGPIMEIGKELINKLVPDTNKRFEAQKELERLVLERRKELLDAAQASDANQTQVNVVEAGSASLFNSGWRPAVGWVCVLGLFGTVLVYPIAQWLSPMYGFPIPPKPEITELMFLLAGMLGLGTLRSIDKKNGVA